MFAERLLAGAADFGQSTTTGNSPWSMLMLMVIVFGIFYFLLIRPQQKERQKMQTMLEDLKVGDRVITTGGILGTVHSISGDELQLKLNEKTKVTILKSAIRGFQNESTNN